LLKTHIQDASLKIRGL